MLLPDLSSTIEKSHAYLRRAANQYPAESDLARCYDARSARDRLQRLGFARVTTRHADGHFGWSGEAPFDAIIVTAAAGFIPPALVEQLRPGGRMMIPVGNPLGVQNLILVTKDEQGDVRTRGVLPVRFVPMVSGIR